MTPETARLLQHWRHHQFSGIRPFFCQVEAVETAIWLTEVAPHFKNGKRILEELAAASREANPELLRLPVADNIPGQEMPMYRNLWEHIGTKMPKKGQGQSQNARPAKPAAATSNRMEALYACYLIAQNGDPREGSDCLCPDLFCHPDSPRRN